MSRFGVILAFLIVNFTLSGPARSHEAGGVLLNGSRSVVGIAKLGSGYVLAEHGDAMYIRKISRGGTTEWDYRVGSGGQITGLAVDSQGAVYVVGFFGGSGQDQIVGALDPFLSTADAFVVSVDAKGERRFARLYGTYGDENFYAIAASSSGIYFGGWVQAEPNPDGSEVRLPSGSVVRPNAQTGVVVRMSNRGEFIGDFVFDREREDGAVAYHMDDLSQIVPLPDGGVFGTGRCCVFRLAADGSLLWQRPLPNGVISSIAADDEEAWVVYWDDPNGDGTGASIAKVDLETGDQVVVGVPGEHFFGTPHALPGGRVAILGSKEFGPGLGNVAALRVVSGEGVVLRDLVIPPASPWEGIANGLLDARTSSALLSIYSGQTGALFKFPLDRPYLATPVAGNEGVSRRRMRVRAGQSFSLRWEMVDVLGGALGFRPELRSASVQSAICGTVPAASSSEAKSVVPLYSGRNLWKLNIKSAPLWRGSCRRYSVSLPDNNILHYEVAFY
jgi:hypothetical protein